MAIDVKPILRAGVILQAASLIRRKRRKRNLIGDATHTIVGTSLIKAQSDIIEGL